MGDAYTVNIGLVLPEVGASDDTWGEKTNLNWIKVDDYIGGVSVPKSYIDDADNARVLKTGDTMLGPLLLFQDPVVDDEAATKRYVVDTATNLTNAINGKVSKSGDTMTGDLVITKSFPTIYLDRIDANGARIAGRKGGLDRWYVRPGNGDPEAGGNSGSNFTIARYDDAGALIDVPLTINRSNGNVGIGITPVSVEKLVVNGMVRAGFSGFVAGNPNDAGGHGALFSYDNVNNRLEIGAVSVAVAWRDIVLGRFGGNVGVGGTPGTKFHVFGPIRTQEAFGRVEHAVAAGTLTWSVGLQNTVDYQILRESGAGNILIPSGNVGIGMTPSSKLHVNGLIQSLDGSVFATTTLASGATGFSIYTGGVHRGGLGVDHGGGPFTYLDFDRYLTMRDSSATYVARMSIDPNGMVGVGPNVPIARLHAHGAGNTNIAWVDGTSAGAALYIQDTDGAGNNGGQVLFGASQGVFAGIKGLLQNGTGPAGDLIFQTRFTSGNVLERMRISSLGDIGIGTPDPNRSGFTLGTRKLIAIDSAGNGTDTFPVFYLGGTFANLNNNVAGIGFFNNSIVATEKRVVSIGAALDGAANSGKFVVTVWNAGTAISAVTIDKTGQALFSKNAKVMSTGSNNAGLLISNPNVNVDFILFQDNTGDLRGAWNNADAFVINHTTGAYTAISDRYLKSEPVPITVENALAQLEALGPASRYRIRGERAMGFLVDRDTKMAAPDLVSEIEIGDADVAPVNGTGRRRIFALNYAGITAPLSVVLLDLVKRVKTLEGLQDAA